MMHLLLLIDNMKKNTALLLCLVSLLAYVAFNFGSKGPQPQPEEVKSEFYTVTGNVTAGFATDAIEK
jgi:hypothetical protein